MMQRLLLAASATLAATTVHGTVLAADSVDRTAVVSTYADIAQAMYEDALAEARRAKRLRAGSLRH